MKYKKIILILLSILFIFIFIFSFSKNKNVKTSIFIFENKNYEKVSFYNSETIGDCKYYKNKKIGIYDVDEVEEGFPIYVYNNCATTLENYINETSKSKQKEACKVQRNYVEKNYSAYSSVINEYNKICYNSKIDNNKLVVKYNNKSCEQMKQNIENDYVNEWKLYEDIYKKQCINTTGDIDRKNLKPYFTEPNNCESLKLVDENGNLYTGILKEKDSIFGQANKCNYRLFFVDGFSSSLENYLKKVDVNKKIEACNYVKNNGENNENETDKLNYNSYCVGKVIGFDVKLEYKYNNKSCNNLKNKIESDYVGEYTTYNDIYLKECLNITGDIDKGKLKPYLVDESNCESLKLVDKKGNLYTGILDKGETLFGFTNKCNYKLFYINGYAASLNDYLSFVNNESKIKACKKTEKDANNGNEMDRLNYNTYCVGKVAGFDKKMEFKYNKQSCEQLKTNIELDYVEHYSIYNNIYKPYCVEQNGYEDIDKNKLKPYLKDANNCESLRIIDTDGNLYTGILETGGTINGFTNQCNYRLFYVNGYATSLNDFLSEVSEDKKIAACNFTKNLALSGSDSDRQDYNLYCVNKVPGFNDPLPFTYNNENCKQLKSKIELNYVEHYSIYNNIYKPYCMEQNGYEDIDKSKLKPYLKDINNCESLKLVNEKGELYTGVLKKGEIVYKNTNYAFKNQCNYRLYYVDGYATTIDDFFNKVDNKYKKKACELLKALSFNGDETEKNNFEKYCKGIIKGFENTKKHLISFDATNGYGIECVEGSSSPTSSVCQYNFYSENDIVNPIKIKLPNVTTTNNGEGLYQIDTDYKFSYWSKDKDCRQQDIKRNEKELIINNISFAGTYYACYEKNASNIIKDVTQIHSSCDSATDYQATLTNRIKITDKYETTDSSKSVTVASNKTDKKYTINKYCNIECTEDFSYTYPAIFETVKSGTYFELIYNPQIKSTYKCVERINYTSWKNDYEKSIVNEIKAYLDSENIKLINESTDKKTNEICHTQSFKCGDSYCNTFYYNYEIRANLYNYIESENNIVQNNYVTSTYCEYNEDINDAKKRLLEKTNQLYEYNKYLSDIPKNDINIKYNEAKNYRELIQEMNNNVCYTALDKEKISEENFYNINPSILLSYEADKNIISTDKNIKLKSINYYKNDTGSLNDEYNEKLKTTETFYINYPGYNYEFNAYNYGNGNNKTLVRTSKQNFNFKTEYNYYTDYFSGILRKGNGNIKLGNVFPVDITTTGKKNITFKIEDTGVTKAVKNVLNNNNNEYKCYYKVTNDIVELDKKTLNNDNKEYKSKFFIRTISTKDVDPNNRLENGLLGANWANDKGQNLLKIIEDKSKGNNTYNPDYLEYSFLLTSEALSNIRKYNKNNKYDEKINDNNYYNCNNIGGECKSKFLDNLKVEKYGKNTPTILEGRNKRKYFIGNRWYYTDSLISNSDLIDIKTTTKVKKSSKYGVCYSLCQYNKDKINNVEECYNCLYRKVNGGILP